MSVFNPCFLIPCYNHGATVPAVIDALTSYGFRSLSLMMVAN